MRQGLMRSKFGTGQLPRIEQPAVECRLMQVCLASRWQYPLTYPQWKRHLVGKYQPDLERCCRRPLRQYHAEQHMFDEAEAAASYALS